MQGMWLQFGASWRLGAYHVNSSSTTSRRRAPHIDGIRVVCTHDAAVCRMLGRSVGMPTAAQLHAPAGVCPPNLQGFLARPFLDTTS